MPPRERRASWTAEAGPIWRLGKPTSPQRDAGRITLPESGEKRCLKRD